MFSIIRNMISHSYLDGKSACRDSNGASKYSSCIDDYIESQIKCKVPWIANDITSYEFCNLVNQTKEYLQLSKKISRMRDSEAAEETGCHIPCKRNEFTTK